VKTIYLIALLTLIGGGWSHAQTNVNTAPTSRRATNATTRIDSVRAEFDLTARRAVYQGDVRVDDPQMKLTCEQLTANLPSSGGHIDHLVALTNVVMDSVDEKGQTNHATSDMAIYDYKVQDGITNETITLSGNARAETAQVILWGEPIKYDRISGSLTAENEHTIFKQSLTSAHTNTNQLVGQTNPTTTVQQTNLPVAKTNFPPGTIQNIDKMTVPSVTQPQ
jgi:lipopolysaccharide transport protein LptA